MTTHQKILTSLTLIVTFSSGHAQTGLSFSGDMIGVFRPTAAASAAVVPLPGTGVSEFRIGVPTGNSFQSGVGFNGHNYTDVHDGDIFSPGLFTYYNGLNRVGTSSGNTKLDLFWRPIGTNDMLRLTTISFGIEATANRHGTLVPDIFRASFQQPDPILLGDEWVKFTVTGLPASFELDENSSANLGGLSVALIPEPPTIGLMLASVAFGLVLLRRKHLLKAA